MSQQHDGHYSPPTPGGVVPQSRRQPSGQPPLITTVFSRAHGSQPNTSMPGSAVSTPLSPMFSPSSSTLPNAPTSMSSRAYNPRQWTQQGPQYGEGSQSASGTSSRESTRESTGMEASMPSPPPPYTPPATVNPLRLGRPHSNSTDLQVSSPLLNSFPGQSSSRASPLVQLQPQFPPPPSKDNLSTRVDRDGSRSRFSLQALTARVKRPDHLDSPSQPGSPMLPATDHLPRPPGGRRAISTGGISLPSGSATGFEDQSSRRASPESSGWAPGMPLPPPPPGPPPSSIGARSTSLNRFAEPRLNDSPREVPASVRTLMPRRMSHANTLGNVPPTPAGWVDDDPLPASQPAAPARQMQPRSSDTPPQAVVSLSRRPARREPSADSIVERRSKSKAGRGNVNIDVNRDESQTSPAHTAGFRKPANLVLTSTDPLLQRRRAERTERADHSTSPESARHNTPLNTSTLTPPYTPSPNNQRKATRHDAAHNAATTSSVPSQDSFVQASLERFHMFIQQEASSPTDKERLELFANFMVHESRIRRDRYSNAFRSMAGEIMELTRDMWRPLSSSATIQETRSMNKIINEMPRLSVSPEGSRKSANVPTSSCSSATEFTPATDTESMCDNNDQVDERPPPTPWGERFQPSLSPIHSVPSMAVSTVPDEEDSRGRSASRWWEGSGEGSAGKGGRKIEMTKQESKYMSLHPNELIVAAQPSPSHSTPTPNTIETSFKYGHDAYPPEKPNLLEEDDSHCPHPSQLDSEPPPGTPFYWGKQPAMPPLEISRLVTLPPPYPRHYPALQNNHPSLKTIRLRHREIAEVISIRGSRSQSDHSWQNTIYVEMINACETSITELVRRVDDDSDNQNTNAAQTEGDERPELLEQLTLLKWLFEAREQLQKQDFDASMQRLKLRSQAYGEHCKAKGDYQQQFQEALRLAQHLQQNQHYFAEQATQRYSQLLEIVERHVSRGVEVQLSAFWDIAPALLEVVQKIPVQDAHSLAGLSVTIPGKELADNPSYRQFPLQYLLHTLTHAKKSAYQFIESQTNLLCLLHEVRTAAMSAELRLNEIRRVMSGAAADDARTEMMNVKRQREDQETGVLKERVGFLEGQWESALGKEIEVVVERVSRFLQEQGGWDEGMEV